MVSCGLALGATRGSEGREGVASVVGSTAGITAGVFFEYFGVGKKGIG